MGEGGQSSLAHAQDSRDEQIEYGQLLLLMLEVERRNTTLSVHRLVLMICIGIIPTDPLQSAKPQRASLV
jgi:hypothetical protein